VRIIAHIVKQKSGCSAVGAWRIFARGMDKRSDMSHRDWRFLRVGEKV
jgi:hypothetical protein